MKQELLLRHFDRITEAPGAIPRLRRFILDLAMRGKLVEQDHTDEPAAELLKRIEAAKTLLLEAGEIKKQEALPAIEGDVVPYPLPATWLWIRVGDGFHYDAGTKRDPKELDPDLWLLELEDIEKDTSTIITRLKVSDRDSLSTKSEFRLGDVLYGKLRPYLNKVIVAPEPGYSTTEIVAIRAFLPLCSPYCCLAFRRPDFVEYVSRLGRGTKMPRLRTPDALAAMFPLPPLAEQHRIVAKVDELMALCDQLEVTQTKREKRRDRLTAASLHHLTDGAKPEAFRKHARFYFEQLPRFTTRVKHIKQLRQTILNLAVHGQLVPQESTEEPAFAVLKRIQTEKDALRKMGAIRSEKQLSPIAAEPFPLPASWAWAKIGDVALFTEYGTSHQSAHSDFGVPILKMGDIQDGCVILGGQKKVPSSIDDLPALYLQRLDLLYNRTNSAELVGKTGIYLGQDEEYTFASYLIRIRFSDNASSPYFFNLAMNAPYFRTTQIEPHLKQQCGQANVNGTVLKNMLVPVPPLAEQRRIVAKVDELRNLYDQLETQLTATHTESRRLLDAVLYDALKPASTTRAA